MTGSGALAVAWKDATGRIVVVRSLKFALTDGQDVAFRLDLRRSVTTRNLLSAHLVLDGLDEAGRADHRVRDASATFMVRPPADAWSDFQILMWQQQTPIQYQALRALGITGGMVETIHDSRNMPDEHQVKRLLQADLPWYVENIATDFYSQYHRWSGDRPVNWRFLAVKERFRANSADRSAFMRDPSLSDPLWLARVRERVMRSVRSQRAYGPLYYNLGDEPGIAETAAFWDFDLSDPSLKGMRAWLKQRYKSLVALNLEWGARFVHWDDVVPTLTGQAMKRTDGNFSSWADFKEWMDVAFARALRVGTEAVHGADPRAVASFEGGQIPGWGGYDYSRLVGAVDAMELYDYGNSIDIVHSLNPQIILLTTSFGGGGVEEHRVWRQLLRGARGMVLWDEKHEFVDASGSLGPRGIEAKDYYSELRNGLGALLINSRPQKDPIAILYSPSSLRIQWMLDHQLQGDAWVDRDAGAEYEDNAIRTAIRDCAGAIVHMGLEPEYLSSAGLEQGKLRAAGVRILILPNVIALSATENREIRGFVSRGGMAIAVGMPGIFDEHGKKVPVPPLQDLFAHVVSDTQSSGDFGGGKAVYPPQGLTEPRPVLASLFASMGLTPAVAMRGVNEATVTDVTTYHFKNGTVDIIGLLRDLRPPVAGERSGQPASGEERIILTLSQPRFVYDLRQGKSLGRTDRIEIYLAPTSPTLLALSDGELGQPTIAIPRTLRLGELGALKFSRLSAAQTAVLHVEVDDPAGRIMERYSGNVIARAGIGKKVLPLALNDPQGPWVVKVTNLLGGPARTFRLQVVP